MQPDTAEIGDNVVVDQAQAGVVHGQRPAALSVEPDIGPDKLLHRFDLAGHFLLANPLPGFDDLLAPERLCFGMVGLPFLLMGTIDVCAVDNAVALAALDDRCHE